MERKSEVLAAILSAIFTGLGQVYNGQVKKGITFLIIGIICAALCAVIIGFVLYPLFWLYNIYDAYRTALDINRNLPPPPQGTAYQQQQTNQPVMKETIIREREIVKVKCQYCQHLVDVTADVCPHCGARDKR